MRRGSPMAPWPSGTFSAILYGINLNVKEVFHVHRILPTPKGANIQRTSSDVDTYPPPRVQESGLPLPIRKFPRRSREFTWTTSTFLMAVLGRKVCCLRVQPSFVYVQAAGARTSFPIAAPRPVPLGKFCRPALELSWTHPTFLLADPARIRCFSLVGGKTFLATTFLDTGGG